MMESGNKIKRVEKALIFLQMVIITMEIIMKECQMAMAFTHGKIQVNMKENSQMA